MKFWWKKSFFAKFLLSKNKNKYFKPIINSQAGVQKSNPEAGGSPWVVISWKTLVKGFKIDTTGLADAENHN